MDLVQLKCPIGHSADMQYHSPSTTKNHGRRVMDTCEPCPASVSETNNTLLEGVTTPVSVSWHVRKARTEGRGFHAATRTFEKAHKTILAWERTLLARHRVLWR